MERYLGQREGIAEFQGFTLELIINFILETYYDHECDRVELGRDEEGVYVRMRSTESNWFYMEFP